MQVDPIKPTLKAPGSERLKLKYDEPLSNFAFNIYLRRYTEVQIEESIDADYENIVAGDNTVKEYLRQGSEQRKALGLEDLGNVSKAGAYTRPLFSST